MGDRGSCDCWTGLVLSFVGTISFAAMPKAKWEGGENKWGEDSSSMYEAKQHAILNQAKVRI